MEKTDRRKIETHEIENFTHFDLKILKKKSSSALEEGGGHSDEFVFTIKKKRPFRRTTNVVM